MADLQDGHHIFLANKFPLVDADGQIYGVGSISHDITERKRAEEALRQSEQRLALAVSATGIGIFNSNSLTGDIETTEQFGYLIGLHEKTGTTTLSHHYHKDQWAERVHPDDWLGLRAKIEECQSQHSPLDAEYRVVGTDGVERWLNVRGVFQDDDRGNATRFLGVIIDITGRKRAEEQLIHNQKTFFELVDRAPFGIYVVDSRFCIAHMNINSQNDAFRNVRPLIGRDFSEAMHTLWHESVAEEIIGRFRHTLETGEPYYSPRFTNPRHDVEIIESYEWELHRITLPDGQYGVICYYFDSTKLRNAELELQEANATLEKKVEERTFELMQRASQLRALTGELTVAEQRERSRLANVLHDHLQQMLVAAKFRLTVLGRGGDDIVKQASREVEELIDESIAASRSLTAELSPPILHEGGLNDGLQWLARRMADTQGLFVNLELGESGSAARRLENSPVSVGPRIIVQCGKTCQYAVRSGQSATFGRHFAGDGFRSRIWFRSGHNAARG